MRNMFAHDFVRARLMTPEDGRAWAPRNHEVARQYSHWSAVRVVSDDRELLERDFKDIATLAADGIETVLGMLERLWAALWSSQGALLVGKLPSQASGSGSTSSCSVASIQQCSTDVTASGTFPAQPIQAERPDDQGQSQ